MPKNKLFTKKIKFWLTIKAVAKILCHLVKIHKKKAYQKRKKLLKKVKKNNNFNHSTWNNNKVNRLKKMKKNAKNFYEDMIDIPIIRMNRVLSKV